MEKLLKFWNDIIVRCSSYVMKFLKRLPGSTENKITFFLWIITISLDPFICYILSIHDEEKHLKIDKTLKNVVGVLFCFHICYRVYMYLHSTNKGRQVFIRAESMALFVSNGLLYLVVTVLIPRMKIRTSVFSIALAIFLVVNMVRVIGIYILLTEEVIRTSSKLADTSKLLEVALIKIVVNLLLYLYGGHLFGGLWYIFAIRKIVKCWEKACSNHSECHFAHHQFIVNSGDNKSINDICFPKKEDAKTYELGIFKEAFESRILEITEFWKKFFYCFRWGIQNVSGFGQNLQVSTYTWENVFVILVSFYGVATFAFFIGNMQNLVKFAIKKLEEKRRKEEAVERKQQELEQWFPFGKLSKELQNRIKEYQQNIWQLTGGVDVENLLSNLPGNLENSIKSEFCLELLKNVDKFGSCSEALAVHLCDYVKPVVYHERTRIIRKGDPIDEMLFVVQGKLWTYSPDVATTGSTSKVPHKRIKDYLQDGDFWGEELIDWVQNKPSSSNIPLSNRTMQALTKVDAFVLGANDLKNTVIMHQNARFIQSVFCYRRTLLSRRNAQMSIQEK